MSDLQRAVAELMKAWPDLDDVDRAVRVKQLRDAGASGRALAQAVGCSEGLIRQLRMAADATDDEKQQARLGELSTRQLIENVRARRKEQEAINRADLKSESQQRMVTGDNPETSTAVPHRGDCDSARRSSRSSSPDRRGFCLTAEFVPGRADER